MPTDLRFVGRMVCFEREFMAAGSVTLYLGCAAGGAPGLVLTDQVTS